MFFLSMCSAVGRGRNGRDKKAMKGFSLKRIFCYVIAMKQGQKAIANFPKLEKITQS